MTTYKNMIALTIFAATFAFTSVSHAQNVDLDFSGFDPSILSTDGGSQVFEDICGDIDVTVTSMGEFDADTHYISTSGGRNAFSSQHNPGTSSNTHSFTFAFSQAIDLVIETLSLDGQEEYLITSDGTENYTNLSGALPNISSQGTGILLDGIGFGGDPVTGAANGETSIFGANTITVTYTGDPTAFPKFGSFILSKPVSVPEPNSAVLLGIGALALLRRRRRS